MDSLQCPHCGAEHEIEDGEDARGLVTYHGEDGAAELECTVCEQAFWAKECVIRTYRVSAVPPGGTGLDVWNQWIG